MFTRKNIDGVHLKVIAIIAMLINHIGIAFHWSASSGTLYFISEFIGKLTFPIMAYLIVEGFYYSKNSKKYGIRLALFWLISIYPYHLMRYGTTGFEVTDLVNNIFFTLLMGLILIIFYNQTKNRLLHIVIVSIFSALTVLSDGQVIGVLIIFAFYRIQNDSLKIILPPLIMGLFIFIVYFISYLFAPQSVPIYLLFTPLGSLCVVPLLLKYNGKRGYSPNWVKWGFYWFYPVHLLILGLIAVFF